MRGKPTRTALRRLLARITAVAPVNEVIPEAAGVQLDQEWVNHPSVQGFGIGPKIIGGKRTAVPALRVYVDIKRPLNQLTKETIPRRLRIPGSNHYAQTDVISIGTMRLQLNTAKVRPVVPGFAIECDGRVGTLGCAVRRRGDEHWYFLASGHVIAVGGDSAKGRPIMQPAGIYHGEVTDRIGRTVEVPAIMFSGEYPNLADCALGRFDDSSLVERYVRLIGPPAGISRAITERTVIQKTGFATDYTTARVRDTNFHVALNYPVPGGGTRRAGFRQAVLCDHYADDGDSGAAIFDENRNLIGLHLCGSTSVSSFCRIGYSADEFDLTFL